MDVIFCRWLNGPASCRVGRLLILLSWLISPPVYFQFIICRLTALEFPLSSWTPLPTLTNTQDTLEDSRPATFLPATASCPELAVSSTVGFDSNNFPPFLQILRPSVGMTWWSLGWRLMTPSLASSTLQVVHHICSHLWDYICLMWAELRWLEFLRQTVSKCLLRGIISSNSWRADQ